MEGRDASIGPSAIFLLSPSGADPRRTLAIAHLAKSECCMWLFEGMRSTIWRVALGVPSVVSARGVDPRRSYNKDGVEVADDRLVDAADCRVKLEERELQLDTLDADHRRSSAGAESGPADCGAGDRSTVAHEARAVGTGGGAVLGSPSGGGCASGT